MLLWLQTTSTSNETLNLSETCNRNRFAHSHRLKNNFSFPTVLNWLNHTESGGKIDLSNMRSFKTYFMALQQFSYEYRHSEMWTYGIFSCGNFSISPTNLWFILTCRDRVFHLLFSTFLHVFAITFLLDSLFF